MKKQPILKSTFTLSIAIGITLLSTNELKAQRAEDIIFNPAKIKTIPGHGMSKAEYPYDEGGKYRKEWVNTWAKSPVTSSTTVRYPIPKNSHEHSNYPAIAKLQNQNVLRQHLEQQKLIAENTRNRSNRRHSVATPPATRQVAYQAPQQTTYPSPQPQQRATAYPSPPQQQVTYNPPQQPQRQIAYMAPAPAPQPQRQTTNVYNVPRHSSESELIQNGFIGPYDRMAQPTTATARPKPNAAPVVVAHNTYRQPSAVQPIQPQRSAASTYHQVKRGDTLFAISKRYGTTVDAIKHANGLTSDLIRVGQNLRLAFAQHALGVPRG